MIAGLTLRQREILLEPISVQLVQLVFAILHRGQSYNERRKEPVAEFKSTAVLPLVKGVSESLRRCLEQQGIRTVFKSETTLRSHLVRPRHTVDPAKQDGVVYRIPCECGQVYIGELRNREIYA